jgi:hypothetical protein
MVVILLIWLGLILHKKDAVKNGNKKTKNCKWTFYWELQTADLMILWVTEFVDNRYINVYIFTIKYWKVIGPKDQSMEMNSELLFNAGNKV